MGDYQFNLKKLHRNHENVGPGAYDLPSLFENYNSGSYTISGLKKNPRSTFHHKDPVSKFISKDHLLDNMLKESPGVGLYKPLQTGTFDNMSYHMSRTSLMRSDSGNISTFPQAKRFVEPS